MDTRNPLLIDRYDFQAGEDEFRVVFMKMIIVGCLPILIALLVLMFWWIVLKRR